nr:phosphate acetyltransferase [Clostridia bacterium]
NIEIIDPFNFPKTSEYISFYCQMRKDHSISKKIARMVLAKNLNLGALMVRLGEGDGLVAGACNLTSSIIKSATLMLGLREGISLPSSFFIMAIPDSSLGEEELLIFADAAVNPEPDSSQLADIAISTAMSAKALLGWQPRVALLSFSTKRSASHPLVDKVIEASRIAQKKAPHLLIEGELQADAALIPQIAERKIKESKVAGRANILIFPDLNAANISYKLVQHLAKARAYGPILQGFARPINDLSRGATVEDIISVIIITAVQAQERRD